MIHVMKWSPIGHSLVFVHEWDVYVMTNLPTTTPVLASPGNGEKNKKYYGIPDWMYEEEMISDNEVLYWNTDATKLAFLETDETGVEFIEFSQYNEIDTQYPETVEIAYPKSGTTISTVNLWVYDITTLTPMQINEPDFDGGDKYFSKLTWANSDGFLATWVNRAQNESVAYLCTGSGSGYNCVSEVKNTETVSGGWVGSFNPFEPLWKPGSLDYWTIYARADVDDPTDGRWQIAEVSASATNARWVTQTNYDILSLLYYDAANDYLYFWAAYNLPRRRHILRVKAG